MTDDLKEWVLEAAGTGYLTEAQALAVVRKLTEEEGTSAPGNVGIAKLMQMIELARSGGLDETDSAHRSTVSYHQPARYAG